MTAVGKVWASWKPSAKGKAGSSPRAPVIQEDLSPDSSDKEDEAQLEAARLESRTTHVQEQQLRALRRNVHQEYRAEMLEMHSVLKAVQQTLALLAQGKQAAPQDSQPSHPPASSAPCPPTQRHLVQLS